MKNMASNMKLLGMATYLEAVGHEHVVAPPRLQGWENVRKLTPRVRIDCVITFSQPLDTRDCPRDPHQANAPVLIVYMIRVKTTRPILQNKTSDHVVPRVVREVVAVGSPSE